MLTTFERSQKVVSPVFMRLSGRFMPFTTYLSFPLKSLVLTRNTGETYQSLRVARSLHEGGESSVKLAMTVVSADF